MSDDVMYCPECNNKYRVFDECPECLRPLLKPSITQKIKGDNNSSIIVNGTNSGSININADSNQQQTTLIRRDKITPLTIGNKPVKNWWGILIGLLGILGSIASVISLLADMITQQEAVTPPMSPIIYPMIMAVSALFFLSSFLLRRSKYIRTPFFTIEIDRKGELYTTRVTGECGICQHPVKLVTRGPEGHRATVLECTQNPDQHAWEFDPTVLGDVGDDYRQYTSPQE